MVWHGMAWYCRMDSDAKELKDTLGRVARHVLEREAGLPNEVYMAGTIRACLRFHKMLEMYFILNHNLHPDRLANFSEYSTKMH